MPFIPIILGALLGGGGVYAATRDTREDALDRFRQDVGIGAGTDELLSFANIAKAGAIAGVVFVVGRAYKSIK